MTSTLAFLLASYLLATVSSLDELKIEVEHLPSDCTEFAGNGDHVEVHYTGSLDATGEVFDSSRSPGRKPLKFVLGQRRVIPGWENGIKGMCVGEKRQLTIPPDQAYGPKGHPPKIPSNAVLVFKTELMSIEKGPVSNTATPRSSILMSILPPIGVVLLFIVLIKFCKKQGAQCATATGRKKKE